MRISILLLLTAFTLMIPHTAIAQYVYLGYGNKAEGNIYEDCLLDDGTRYIMSSMCEMGKFGCGLCMFVQEDGEAWYGLAIESREYIPKNGLMVIVPDDDSGKPYVLGQRLSDNAQVTRIRSKVNPIFIFGGGKSSMAFSTYQTTDVKDVSFAIYDIPEDVLFSMISHGVKDIRISGKLGPNHNRIIRKKSEDCSSLMTIIINPF